MKIMDSNEKLLEKGNKSFYFIKITNPNIDFREIIEGIEYDIK